MSPRSEEYFWRARRSLRSARLLLGEGLFEDAVSRAYYAMVEAAQGALSERDISTRTHSGLWTKFNEVFIHAGELNDSWPAAVARAQRLRERGDYEAERIDEGVATEVVTEAASFVEAASSAVS
ncbi:MAG: HEPN domain-containing protein [Solirubrobacterales bacterium]